MEIKFDISPYIARAKAEYKTPDYASLPKEDVYEIVFDDFFLDPDTLSGKKFYRVGVKFHINSGLANGLSYEWKFSILPYIMDRTAGNLVFLVKQSGQDLNEAICHTPEGLIAELNNKLKGKKQQAYFPGLERALFCEAAMQPSVCGTGYEDPSAKDDENDMDYIRNRYL